jgi:uncharacterized protein (TIGR02145 family)
MNRLIIHQKYNYLIAIALTLIIAFGCEKENHISDEVNKVKVPPSNPPPVVNDPTPIVNNTVMDRHGNEYPTVIIGSQEWMAENLKATRYNDGGYLRFRGDRTRFNEKVPAYSWYDNDYETNGSVYGALYNWHVVDPKSNGGRNICPTGWRVPGDTDFIELVNYLHNNGFNYNGSVEDTWESNNNMAVSISVSNYWEFSSQSGSIGSSDYTEKRNVTGFSALPGGKREEGGLFSGLLEEAHWWTSTEYQPESAWSFGLCNYSPSLNRGYINKDLMFAIRCIKD